MRVRRLLPVIGLFVLAASAGAEDRATRRELDAVYARMAQATRKKDLQTILDLGAPDFKMKQQNGQVLTLQGLKQTLAMQMAMVQSIDAMEMKIQKLRVKGKTAETTVAYKMAMTSQADQKTGKSHIVADTGVTHDVLVKTPQGWKFKSVERVKSNMTMDGKPFSLGGGRERKPGGKSGGPSPDR